ncbi:MAG: chemotaxis response regulator protein-glutamate methylesterase [Peptococcaceae bacterium]|nr:chemotaxis response regulator protein-glutamate methylesterase [Peptococcaceae bacterium]
MTKSLKAIRVLVVDDSPFIRMSLTKILNSYPEIEVVDTARDGKEGILKLQALKPDVVTMDVEMPVMNGLQALEEIMRWQPTPVIVLSAVTTEGAKLSMKALELGAAEVVAKPSGRRGDNLETLAEDLLLKIKSVAGIDPLRLKHRAAEPVKVSRPTQYTPTIPSTNRRLPQQRIEVVAIGTSTGGPNALQNVLTKLPKNFPVPILVAQHMPVGFTASLANRLDGLCQINVKEVEDGEVLKAGTAYVGVAGKQFSLTRKGSLLAARVSDESLIATFYRPSVDIMFMSLAEQVGAGVLAVVMTGMGSDGLLGTKKLKAKGAFAIAESEQTCIVYGMPKSIVEAGLADRVETLPNIAKVIMECVERR